MEAINKINQQLREEKEFFFIPIQLIVQHMMLLVKLTPLIDVVYHENPMVEMVVQIQMKNFFVELLYQ